ncbi:MULTISPECIES: GNAT family N-acetyltransferase [Chryseobacterium]|uniref:Ribosomal-protein-alanine N-acetyltransferase n=1 Tax=Chryseobacterium camelliae TaxID=1265445 RepID=A0ABU0TKL8_9FLAO|nr:MULTISPECIES: GNAT family N-acetyltransferase [Chryseobacterium]MDT3408561.1 ribosomal-protein-alanine N-acetyltransferase [Pseudacidovorax intermedius]MDQ1097584.1 ribosomal-protein-alanine N-acetyltransferase [Chryseobacterium camelliae]MDQ1101513.1 ribosomal-protein-alanine N-acetyltransferase [Chryseobacterium sp. SORGH_AS_1048]MDR6084956.1 ribosomal-protein-alanine N-acetyltransferase [Chryseobacterium sp. SORGH_AS_0909]MDR6129309.1 ribosomal-protein-alanine N-acetyltransferase [Chryse
MTSSITIREYQTKDKSEVINLIRLNTPKYFAVEEEDLNQYLETERELYYVLLYDQKIVGCGGINFADNNTVGKISWDILHPDYQGKSLGTKLLNYRIDKLNSIDGIQKITVRTSQVAYRFYEKLGFELFEVKKDYWAEGFDMYNMEYKTKYNQNENRNPSYQPS